jgi:hypothetical protein
MTRQRIPGRQRSIRLSRRQTQMVRQTFKLFRGRLGLQPSQLVPITVGRLNLDGPFLSKVPRIHHSMGNSKPPAYRIVIPVAHFVPRSLTISLDHLTPIRGRRRMLLSPALPTYPTFRFPGTTRAGSMIPSATPSGMLWELPTLFRTQQTSSAFTRRLWTCMK